MTQPPPDPRRYPTVPPPRDRRYRQPGPVPAGRVEPHLPPPYPPGQEPIPPRRPRRRTPLAAPLLAFVCLVLIAAASLWATNFLDGLIGDATAGESDPDVAAVAAADSDGPGVGEGSQDDLDEPLAEPTAEPTELPIVEPPSDERAEVRGSILFTRSGDIWAASGTTLTRLTSSDSDKADMSPVWSPDGKNVYFIRTTKRTTSNSRLGGKYTLYPTDLMRMKPDGGNRKKVYGSLIRDSRGLWFSHVLQPSVSPDGNVAVVSDGPAGAAEEVTLHLVNARNGSMRKVDTPSAPRLGHNDPAFSPDGKKIAFTYNDGLATAARPRIGIHTCRSRVDCSKGKVKYLRPGFANPSWSPDGQLLAVEATDGTGRDIVVVNARRGDVRVELTTDGNSFAPVFSPAGDQIAYLHRDGLDIDLRVMTLEFDEQGRITMVDDRPVTSDGGIDGISDPSWFIPTEGLPGQDDDSTVEAPDEAIDQPTDDAPPPPPGS